jgi:hypothetical protein
MPAAENGGFLGHTYFFTQNSILFHELKTLVSIFKVTWYGRDSALGSQQQIHFRDNRKTSVAIWVNRIVITVKPF